MVEEIIKTTKSKRVKVRVVCQACGHEFIMRGTPSDDGHVETGFKTCVCDSTDIKISKVG